MGMQSKANIPTKDEEVMLVHPSKFHDYYLQ